MALLRVEVVPLNCKGLYFSFFVAFLARRPAKGAYHTVHMLSGFEGGHTITHYACAYLTPMLPFTSVAGSIVRG